MAPTPPSKPGGAKPSASRWIEIGVVGRPHGLRGAFFISGRDEPVPKSYRELAVGNGGADLKPLRILTSKLQNGRPLIELEGITDRTAVDRLVGQKVFVAASRIKVAADEYLWRDLEGRRVLDAAGTEVGILDRIYNVGASDIAVIRASRGEVELPLIAEYFALDELASEAGAPLHMTVDSDLFEDLWQEVR